MLFFQFLSFNIQYYNIVDYFNEKPITRVVLAILAYVKSSTHENVNQQVDQILRWTTDITKSTQGVQTVQKVMKNELKHIFDNT
jgi:hypothetical protein